MTSRDQASLSNHSAALYNKHTKFVYSPEYTAPVINLLAPQAGERIIDLGCGTGELTAEIERIVGPNGAVFGVDSSTSMLEKARGTYKGITFLQADIQELPSSLDSSLAGSFDAVFTNATLHWCKANPEGAIKGMLWLLKPGGRIAFEFGGFGNTVGVRAALHEVLRRRSVDPISKDPWFFPTAEQYQNLLANHGLITHDIKLFPRPTPLSTDLYGWLETFARKTFFVDFDDGEASGLMREVESICAPDAFWATSCPGMGNPAAAAETEIGQSGWQIMYVRLRGTARRS